MVQQCYGQRAKTYGSSPPFGEAEGDGDGDYGHRQASTSCPLSSPNHLAGLQASPTSLTWPQQNGYCPWSILVVNSFWEEGANQRAVDRDEQGIRRGAKRRVMMRVSGYWAAGCGRLDDACQLRYEDTRWPNRTCGAGPYQPSGPVTACEDRDPMQACQFEVVVSSKAVIPWR